MIQAIAIAFLTQTDSAGRKYLASGMKSSFICSFVYVYTCLEGTVLSVRNIMDDTMVFYRCTPNYTLENATDTRFSA